MLIKKLFSLKKLALLSVLVVLMISFAFGPRAFSEEEKEYRQGKIFYINGKDYIIASNKQFVEILEITADDKLVQVSEVHGLDQARDLYVYSESGRTFLIVATGQYLVKYDISNPITPQVLLKRNLYEWHYWSPDYKGVVGSIYFLAGNKDYLFGLGAKGVRSFDKNNLYHYKIYETAEKVYGLAVDDKSLYVLTQSKGIVFDILSGQVVREYASSRNDALETRRPFIDQLGTIYSLTDNGLIKINSAGEKKYFSPTAVGVKFSYAAETLPTGELFFANGYGVAKFDKDFKKLGFLFSANGYVFGPGSWASSVDAAATKRGNRIAVFNKTSVVLLDGGMKVLFKYKYKPLYSQTVSTELGLKLSTFSTFSGDSVNLEIFGFWPNEPVKIDFGTNGYEINTNNLGYGRASLIVPGSSGSAIVLNARGLESGLKYQTTFQVK